MTLVNIERTIAYTEGTLSVVAIIPAVGSIPAVVKVALAALQTVAGLFVMLGSLPFVWHKDGRDVFTRSFSHVVNGVANVVAGILEAVPLVGTVIGICKIVRYQDQYAKPADHPSYSVVHTGQLSLVIGYQILEDHPEFVSLRDGLGGCNKNLPQ